jgi:hypothetical protein
LHAAADRAARGLGEMNAICGKIAGNLEIDMLPNVHMGA